MTRLAKLQISDGTTTYDLLETTGFSLKEWRPARAPLKGDGSWSSSPLSDGRSLVAARQDNAVETFSFVAAHYGQDTLSQWMQDLERLLLRGREYWTTRWQSAPVYIEARGQQETNTRYAILYNYALSGEGDPYQQPFFPVTGRTAHDEMTLVIERRHWLSAPPTEDLCVRAEAGEFYKNYFRGRQKLELVGGAWEDACIPEGTALHLLQEGGGANHILQEGVAASKLEQDQATTYFDHADDCYVSNFHAQVNLTHIYYYDASVPSSSANLALAALPFRFFPVAANNGDIAYFGIDTTSENAMRFSNLIFNLSSPWTFAAGESTLWEYWNGGAWVGLTVQDNTGGALDDYHSFQTGGCVGVFFSGPLMEATTINGINAYWVRCTLTAAGPKTPPGQTKRLIYTVTWPFIEIGQTAALATDTPDTRGDLPALARLLLHNQNSYSSGFDRVMVGLRSLSRGTAFTPYLNLSDRYGVVGAGMIQDVQVILDSPESTWIDPSMTVGGSISPVGRCIAYSAEELSDLRAQFHVVIGEEKARQYAGRFRCLLRYSCYETSAWMRLRFTSGALSSANYYMTPLVQLSNAMGYMVADFGIVVLPILGEDGGAESQQIFISAEMQCDNAPYMWATCLYDIILLPVDEWFGDFAENIATATYANPTLACSVLSTLDIDSIGNPRRSVSAFLRDSFSAKVQTAYPPVVAGPAILQANQAQRLWFFTMGYNVNTGVYGSNYAATMSVRVRKVERYTSMRGAR